jgi:3-oxoacyl-[acyl-carrier protein] reductase
MQNYLDLTGKVALVTGGSSGIGAATATLLAELGARVSAGFFRNEAGAAAVCARITAAGGRATSIGADVRRIQDVRSAMLCSQAVAPSMIARRTGAIVNVASIAGRNGGGPGAGAYSITKGALITFTKSLAKQLAPHGVRVNAVSPGVIDTPFHEVFSTPEMIRGDGHAN